MDDDGSSSVEDDDGSSSVDDNDGGLSVESSVGDDDGSSSVGTELAHELARWEEMEWVPEPEPTEEENAVLALHIVRRREFTEYNPKLGFDVPTRFCLFNIALFDFEKESLAGLGPPLRTLTQSDWRSLDTSVNLISAKILESDAGYPISIFSTILARDDIDFKCVYLFRRSRDCPQVITSPDDMLTLTGPYRGLASTYCMFFRLI
uniref:DUF6598 domain-containing protein n=1 Tax=Arundo donax TaxID=35708 RepID=A0A0A9BR83_ARUDO